MDTEYACCLGNITVALDQHAFDVLAFETREAGGTSAQILFVGGAAVGQCRVQLISIARFDEIIRRAYAHRLNGGGDGAVTRQHDDSCVRGDTDELFDELQSGNLWHAKVGDDGVELLLSEQGECFAGSRGRVHAQSAFGERAGKAFTEAIIVVDE